MVKGGEGGQLDGVPFGLRVEQLSRISTMGSFRACDRYYQRGARPGLAIFTRGLVVMPGKTQPALALDLVLVGGWPGWAAVRLSMGPLLAHLVSAVM